MSTRDNQDDSFELYDLRVEVVCPPGERILCGAKAGDFFTLEGELLSLPPGQSISIYSLGRRIIIPVFFVPLFFWSLPSAITCAEVLTTAQHRYFPFCPQSNASRIRMIG